MNEEKFGQLVTLTVIVGIMALLMTLAITHDTHEAPAYCSKCEHIYYDNDAHCGVCGTLYIKNKPEVTEKWES